MSASLLFLWLQIKAWNGKIVPRKAEADGQAERPRSWRTRATALSPALVRGLVVDRARGPAVQDLSPSCVATREGLLREGAALAHVPNWARPSCPLLTLAMERETGIHSPRLLCPQ